MSSDLERARVLALRPHGWQYATTSSFSGPSVQREVITGDTARNFQQISDKICEWFAAWQPWQQRQLLFGITDRCASSQLEYLATTLEPVLHRDFITTLKKRYPTAPFKEMKRRREAKARAKALKNFEASVRPRSTLSMKSEGPLSSKDGNDPIDRPGSLSINTFNPHPELLIEPKEVEMMKDDSKDDSDLLKFAELFCNNIISEALEIVRSENGDESSKNLVIPKTDILGNVDTKELMRQVILEEIDSQDGHPGIEGDGKENKTQFKTDDSNHVGLLHDKNVSENEAHQPVEQKTKVSFLEEKDEETQKSTDDVSNLMTFRNFDIKNILSKWQKESKRKPSTSDTTPKNIPKMHQARLISRRKPSLVITKPLVHQSLPNPLAKHHVTVNKRVELLKSYPASSRASSVARSHQHYSARDDPQQPTQFFPKHAFEKLGPMQMELRTGLVNRPTGVGDIYTPIQRLYKNSKWWNNQTSQGKKYSRPDQNNLLSQYKAQIKQIWEWIMQWQDHEKLTILVNVIKLCDSEQISYLTQCLAERLQARMDISWLPDHILLKIFSSLDPVDLERCSQVCKRWKYLTSTDDLWMIKCHEFGLEQGIQDITKMVRVSRKPKQSIDWRAAYEELKTITHGARDMLPLPQDAAESVTGASSFLDDRTSVTSFAERRLSVLTLGQQDKPDGQMKVPHTERTERRASSFNPLQDIEKRSSVLNPDGEMENFKESRLKLGVLSKYLLKVQNIRKVLKDKSAEEVSNQETETETETNSTEDALDSFEQLRNELLQSLPQRNVEEEEEENDNLKEEEIIKHRSTAQTAITMDFSKFGQSTLESRMERMRRLKKNNSDDGEEALDVRPELLQARDLKTMVEPASNPLKMFIIPNKNAQSRLEKQAAFVKSVKQVRKLQAHMDSVLCLQMDSKRLISGSMDRTIRIWDIRSGRSVHKLYGHKGGVCCIDFDDDMMVSGSWDSSVQVWDMANFERKAVLLGHTSTVSSIKKTSTFAISASHDGTIRIWCLTSFKCLAVHQVTKLHILSMALDGQHVLVGCSDKSMKLVDLADGKCVRTFSGHSNPVSKLLLSGNLIITGTAKGQLYFWTKDNGKLESVIQAHEGPILSINLHHGHFFTSSGDMTIKEWNLASMSCLRILEGHKGPVNDFKVSEKYMVSCSTDGLIRVWDFITIPKRPGGHIIDKIPIKVVNKHTGSYSQDKVVKD